MTELAKLTIRIPKWRVRVSITILWLLAPILSDDKGEALALALSDWTRRGIKSK